MLISFHNFHFFNFYYFLFSLLPPRFFPDFYLIFFHDYTRIYFSWLYPDFGGGAGGGEGFRGFGGGTPPMFRGSARGRNAPSHLSRFFVFFFFFFLSFWTFSIIFLLFHSFFHFLDHPFCFFHHFFEKSWFFHQFFLEKKWKMAFFGP